MSADRTRVDLIFAEERIAHTLEEIGGLIALIFRLNQRGIDAADLNVNLARLKGVLQDWNAVRRIISAQVV